jgi:putative membrane protein
MVVSLLVRWVVLAGAVELTAWVLPGVSIAGGVVSHLVVALFIGLCNVLVPFITGRLPQPSSVVLLALLTLAVNAVLIWVFAFLTSLLAVSGLLVAALAALLISVFAAVLSLVADRLLAARADRSGPAPATRG